MNEENLLRVIEVQNKVPNYKTSDSDYGSFKADVTHLITQARRDATIQMLYGVHEALDIVEHEHGTTDELRGFLNRMIGLFQEDLTSGRRI